MAFLHQTIALALLITPTAIVFAADAVNLQQVYQAAVENDSRFLGVKANTAAQRTLLAQARARTAPSISAAGSYSHSETDKRYKAIGNVPSRTDDAKTDNYGWAISITQSIVDFRTIFGLRSVKALVAQAEANLRGAEQDLIVRTAQAYFNILRARDLLESVEAEEAAFKRQFDQAKQRHEFGLVSINDVLEAEAAYDEAVANRTQAAGNQLVGFAALRAITNQNYVAIGRLANDFPIVRPDPVDMEVWAQAAQANNPMVRALQFALQAAKQNLKIKRAEVLPNVNATARLGQNYCRFDGCSMQGDKVDNTQIELRVSIPLFRGGAGIAENTQSRQEYNEAKYRLEEQLRNVDRDSRNLYQQVVSGVSRIQARDRAQKSAEKAVQAVRIGYGAGTRTIVDLLAAERALYQSQFNYASARYDYVLNTFGLKQIIGGLNSTTIEQLNHFITTDEAVEALPPVR